MFDMMSPPPLDPAPEKAVAIFPMISEVDGRIAPAITAAQEPIKSRSLSCPVRLRKNFVRGTA